MIAPLTAAFVQDVRARFDRDGFIVIDEGLSRAEIEAANTALDRLSLPQQGDLRPLVDKGDVFLDHLLHPMILPYALALLGGQVSVMGSCVTVIPPGAGPMEAL